MSDAGLGRFAWFDLTVPEAGDLRDFYAAVLGWQAAEHQMDGYADYMMQTPDGTTVAGNCHAKGVNDKLPVCWTPYVTVASVPEALQAAKAKGATIVDDRKSDDGQHFAVIKDPAGAHFAVFQPPA
jgi:predicted enzyme related to lactoylglutathione lyase